KFVICNHFHESNPNEFIFSTNLQQFILNGYKTILWKRIHSTSSIGRESKWRYEQWYMIMLAQSNLELHWNFFVEIIDHMYRLKVTRRVKRKPVHTFFF